MRTRLAGALLALALTATGCSGDGADDADPDGPGRSRSGSTAQEAGADRVRTEVVVGEAVGRIAPRRHQEVARRVARVVDGWWDAAFVDAAYPRTRYRGAFPRFTRAAAAQAWRQRDLMTSRRLGDRIDALVPVSRRVAVDVLAVRQVPRGATARVRMVYRTEGQLTRRVQVQGRLVLTWRGGWRVFGFDVTQGPAPLPRDRDRRAGGQGSDGKTSGKSSGKGGDR